MLEQALGSIETVGLCAAFEAADVACKSADVSLVGYELARGGGLVTVKVLGQVGAVSAAIAAAKVAAARVNTVVATSVIARPHPEIGKIVLSAQTKGLRLAPPRHDSSATGESPPQQSEKAASDSDEQGPTPDEQAPSPAAPASPREPTTSQDSRPREPRQRNRSRSTVTTKEMTT